MEPEHRDISATILIEVPNTVMHRFVNKEKNLFTTGTCKIAKIQNPNQNTVYFVNLNSFYYTLNNSVIFIRLVYDDTVSYLFPHFDSGLSSITLLKNSHAIENFQEILRNTVTFMSWEQAMSIQEIKVKTQTHCPAGIEHQPIVCADKVKKLIKDTGKFLGEAFKTIGGYLTEGVKYMGDYIDKKVEEPNEKGQVNPQTKQKWEKLKSGTSQAVDVSKDIFNKYLLPVVNKGVDYTKQIGSKMESSSNESVKYARELAGVSGQAINRAFVGLAEGSTQFAGELSKETRKIVQKRYGDDYVNTFIGPEGQKQEQKVEKKQGQIKETEHEDGALYPKLDDDKK